MKSLVLCFLALSYIAMAQDIKGVSIGGTLYSPTIRNNSDQPVMGYTLMRHTDNGIDVPLLVLDKHNLIRGNHIAPGGERSMLGLASGSRVEYATRSAGVMEWHREGNAVSYELTGVLHDDGTFRGADYALQAMAKHVEKLRKVARSMQANPDRYTALRTHRATMGVQSLFASMDEGAEMAGIREAMNRDLLAFSEERSEGEADVALDRIVGLPQVHSPPVQLAFNGTFDDTLPDASLLNYSGDQFIYAVISSVDFRRNVSAGNTADCGAGGAQGTPANPFAFFVGGRVVWSGSNGYPVDPSTGRVVLQCLPIDVQVGASWRSRRQDMVNDHLTQANTNTPQGGLPGSYASQTAATEACSLIGYSGLGSPFVEINDTGECIFYGSGTGPVPMNGGATQ